MFDACLLFAHNDSCMKKSCYNTDKASPVWHKPHVFMTIPLINWDDFAWHRDHMVCKL